MEYTHTECAKCRLSKSFIDFPKSYKKRADGSLQFPTYCKQCTTVIRTMRYKQKYANDPIFRQKEINRHKIIIQRKRALLKAKVLEQNGSN